jgi:hypothetical protein
VELIGAFKTGKGWWRSNHARFSVDFSAEFLGKHAAESPKITIENGCF